MSNLADDPEILRECLESIASSDLKPREDAEAPFFVKWGPIADIKGEHFALKSRAHPPEDFVMTCGSKQYLEESAQFMNKHLAVFLPTEDPVVLHDRLIEAIECGEFIPSSVFPG